MDNHDNIYKKLLDVDTSKVSHNIKPWEVKGDTIWGMRVSDRQADFLDGYTELYNFGNPFMTGGFSATNGIDKITAEGNNALVSEQYYRWLSNNDIPINYSGDVTLLGMRRDWILSNLQRVRDASEIAYNGTAAKEKVSHINALLLVAHEEKVRSQNELSFRRTT